MTPEQVLDLFRRTGALWEGHFLLSSGLHSDRYVQCARVLQYPEYAAELCRALAERFAGERIAAVVGPAIGGILVAHELARAFGCRALFTEREEGKMTLRRGLNLEAGERVLVAEDVITTAGSVREVMGVVRNAGAQVVGVAALVDRSGGRADTGVRTEALLVMTVPAYRPDECPMCRQGVPLVKPGSRQI